jgi:SAM-dependent methyltransferase
MKLPSTMIYCYWTAILCVTFQTSIGAYQPDVVTHKKYPVTLDRLQEQLSDAKTVTAMTTINPADPGPPNYWFHPKMHSFGNHGPLGAVHATVAPYVTKLIDVGSYNGENIRDHIAMDLKTKVNKADARIVDLACGVGMSTRSLHKAFPKSSKLVGVDTSPQMIRMAKAYTDPQSIASKTIDMVSRALFHAKGITKLPNHAQEIAASSIEFTEANAEDTGLETGSFDLATIM